MVVQLCGLLWPGESDPGQEDVALEKCCGRGQPY